jgi:hypothetical protein
LFSVSCASTFDTLSINPLDGLLPNLPLFPLVPYFTTASEAEFLDVIGIKVFRVFLLAIHSHLYKWILLPLPLLP